MIAAISVGSCIRSQEIPYKEKMDELQGIVLEYSRLANAVRTALLVKGGWGSISSREWAKVQGRNAIDGLRSAE